jgi:battenin
VGDSRAGCAHWCWSIFSTLNNINGVFRRLTSCISKVLPFVIPLTYFLLLPRPHAFSTLAVPGIEDFASSRSEYTQLPVSEEDAGVAVVEPIPLKTKALSIWDKWQLLKPMIPRYMMPLCKFPVNPAFS